MSNTTLARRTEIAVKINGVDIKDLAAEYGMNVRITGDTVRFTINEEWLNDGRNSSGELNSVIGTALNTLLIIAVIVGVGAVAGLVIGIMLMIRANKRRKEDYLKALEHMKQQSQRLGYADVIKRAREGTLQTEGGTPTGGNS